MSKFNELYGSLLKEHNEFIRIDSAHLDNYPAIQFIDTDKDIGLAIHANQDHFDVIYNFDNKKSFTNMDMALDFAKTKGEEMYAVYDHDSRTHHAIEDFLSHAKSIIGSGMVDMSQKYDSSFDDSNDDSYVTEKATRLSAGMLNGFRRTANIKSECGGCGFGIPRYRGRYPNYCPACGEGLEASVKDPHADVPNDVPLDEAKMDLKGFSQLIIDKGGKGISTGDAKKYNVPFEVFLQMPSKAETLVKNAKKVIDHFNKKGK